MRATDSRSRADTLPILVIKTRASQFEAVRDTIQRVNTYERPEILGYRVDMASPAFAAWIEKMTEPRARKAAPGGAAAPRPKAVRKKK